MNRLFLNSGKFEETINDVSETSIFIGSVSFEDRHKGALVLMKGRKLLSNFSIFIIEIEDNESFYKDSCNELQKKNLEDLKYFLGDRIRPGIKGTLSNSDFIVQEIVRIIEKEEKDVFFDISTIPKKIFFPIIKFLYENWVHNHKVFIIYTKAEHYPIWLSKDPEEISYLPGFAGHYAGGKECVWIPILGFEGGLAKKIYESGGFNDIYPIIGFPSIMVDRVLYANKDIIDKLPNGLKDITYCPTDDPFETYNTIKQIISRNKRNNRHFILSPMGTKPQSLGCCLLAIEENLPVMYAQPKTYSPNYSNGIADVFVYQLVRSQSQS